MARSDLLISLLKAGALSPDPRFRVAAEAIIAEERAKNHTILADELSRALSSTLTGNGSVSTATLSSLSDLLIEIPACRSLVSLTLPNTVSRECQLLVEEHHRADLLRSFALSPRHRILLVGPPGNGKTSVAHALAHDLMIPLYLVRYEGLIGSYLGETAARLRKVFDFARQRACVLFFDEFDTLGKERGDVHESGEIKRVVSTLLLQMDQLPSHVVIVTATNHQELLDRAVWRRFEVRLELPHPTPKQAHDFFLKLLGAFKPARSAKLKLYEQDLTGASYSEIEELFRDITRRTVLAGPDPDVVSILRDRMDAWKRRIVVARAGQKRNSR